MKKTISLVLAVIMTLALCACGSSAPAASTTGAADAASSDGPNYDNITLTMAVNGTDTQIDTKVANYFKELVEAESNGSITIEVYPNDQLAGGNATKGIEMIADGSTDLAAYATSVLSVLDERLSIGTVPWTFNNYTEARETIDATGLAYYDSVLQPQGITVIGSFHNGFRQLTNSKHAVTTPEDLKGLKIRVPGSEVYMNFFKAFGADPVAMSWSEVFTALQQGTIDGQENGVSITSTSGVVEVQKYMTIWNYTYENDLFLANNNIWESLTEDTRAMLTEKALEACNWGRDQVEAEQDELIAQFKEQGMQVDVLTAEQLEPFQAVVADLRQSFFEKYGAEACAAFGVELG